MRRASQQEDDVCLFFIMLILTFTFKRDHEGEHQRETNTTVLYLVYYYFFQMDSLFTLFTSWDTVTLLILHPQSQRESHNQLVVSHFIKVHKNIQHSCFLFPLKHTQQLTHTCCNCFLRKSLKVSYLFYPCYFGPYHCHFKPRTSCKIR